MPISVPVDIAFTGEQAPVPVETATKVGMPVSLMPPPVPAPVVSRPVVVPEDDEEDYQSRGSKLPLILGGLALAGLAAFGVVKYGKPKEVVETVKPVDPPPVEQPPVVDVKPPEPAHPVRPPVVVRPPIVRPTTGKSPLVGITAQTIALRIERYESKLAEKERASGSADRDARQMLLQARALADQAETDVQRLKAWKYLDEIQHKLEAP